jgi:uncharacterized protein YjgD (DUF1641 family)
MAQIKGNLADGATYWQYDDGNYQRDLDHKYLLYTQKSMEGCIPLATYEICRSYAGKEKMTPEQWKRDKRELVWHYEDLQTDQKKFSLPFNYKKISDSIRTYGFFYFEKFNLPHHCCTWLDCATNMKVTFHKKTDEEKPWINFTEGGLKEHFGDHFPIAPSLNREGHLYSTFLPPLLRRIMKNRDEIVQNSQNAFQDDWVFRMKDLISDSISLIDITLNSLYIKAEYNPTPKWHFDKDKLGTRVNRRLRDKLSWVHKITGNQLNIEKEKDALEAFKNLRNHFSHFDPPCFVITIEEITQVLNQVMEIGIILVKIRQSLGVISSIELINFILQKKVIFNHEPEFGSRVPMTGTEGYITSTWPF